MPRHVQRIAAASGMLALLLGFLFAVAPQSNAVADCTIESFPNGRNIGYSTPAVTTTFGVHGRIEFNNPNLCTDQYGSDGLSAAWVMLEARSVTDPTNSDADGWAQVGYLRMGSRTQIDNPNPGLHYFGQITQECRSAPGPCSGSPLRTRFGGTPSSAVSYDAYLRQDDDRIHLYFDGVNLMHVGYDTTGVWQNQWSCYYAEETFDAGDDMPGTDADRTHFDNLKRYLIDRSLDFVQTLNRTGPGTHFPQYHLSPYSGGDIGQYEFDVWTDRS